jgi:hypothetical protein
VRCHDARANSFVTKIRGEVFSHFHAVTMKRHSSMWKWPFGLPRRILCKHSPWSQRKWWACSWLCSSPFSLFFFRSLLVWTFHVRLMISSSNAFWIFVRVPSQFFRDLHKMWCIRPSVHPAAWNFVHWLSRYANTVIYRCIALLQLLYRLRQRSMKLWILHRASVRAWVCLYIYIINKCIYIWLILYDAVNRNKVSVH